MTLTEKAQRYYDELSPHAKKRKGAFYINELLKELADLKSAHGEITEFDRAPNMRGYYISSNAPRSGKFIKLKEI